MNLNPLHIWASMGPLSKVIASVLLLMALATLAVAFERFVALLRGERESRGFARKAVPLVERWDHAALVELAKGHAHAPLAKLVAPVVAKYVSGAADPTGGLDPVERARREAARQLEAIGAQLRRGMSVLASVGSISPFVGLLGTVVGIITAFQGIGNSGSAGLGAVSAGIAEALVETALGLMVAIPAVLLFNYLNTRIAGIEGALGRSSGELIDEMENEHGRSAGSVGAAKKAAA